jgi:hypothetical protein
VGAPEDAERAARVVRAYTLWTQRWDLRSIGAEIGVSHETVRTYVAEYRDAIEWRESRDRTMRTGRVVALLETVIRRGIARLEAVDEDGQPVERYADIAPHLVRAVAELNRVEGNYAPLRVSVDDDRRPPDPALLAAMEDEARRAERLDADEVRRELEA